MIQNTVTMSCINLIILANVAIISSLIGLSEVTAAEGHLIQMLEDDVGAENFTYYRLQRPGMLVLELVSLEGDVDIYLSTEVQHPDYDTYDLKSDSCGTDIIIVPSKMQRPAYISLFGHPNHIHSKYRLNIFEREEPIVEDYEYFVNKYERYYFEEMEQEMSGMPKSQGHKPGASDESSGIGEDDDTLPPWWKILLAVLEFCIEIIL